MDPNPAEICRLLRAVERVHHRSGWDGSPMVYVLYDRLDRDTAGQYRLLMGPMGRPVHGPDRWSAQPAVPVDHLRPRPAHALYRFALNLSVADEVPAVAPILDGFRAAGFVGLALAVEAWTYRGDPEERAALPGRSLADIPGSVESRIVVGYDTAGTTYHVARMRGQPPTTEIVHPGDAGDVVGGAIRDALRLATQVIAGQPCDKVTSIPAGWDWDDQTYLGDGASA